MKPPYDASAKTVASEIAIVDTFTKLIFGQESQYDADELQIIQALRAVDANVSAGCYRDVGVYLRALGVREMIALVSRVQAAMADICGLTPRGASVENRHSTFLRASS